MKPFLLLLVVLILGCDVQEKISYDLVLKNGNVIDLEKGIVQQQDIFISDGRIVRLLNTAEEGYDAKKIIDVSGKYVLPGFWDNHVHFRGGDSLIDANKNFLNLFIANGITTVRDAGGDLTPWVMAWNKAVKNGKLTGPNIFTSGPKIDGVKASWAGSLEVDSEAAIASALDSLQAIETHFVKLYDSKISGELYLKTIMEAEKRGLLTSGHMPYTVTLNETIAAGIDGIEHLYYIMKGCSASENEITQKLRKGDIGFWEAMPLLQESYDERLAQKTFQSLVENRVFVVPTLHIGSILSYLDKVDHSQDTYLNYMGEGIVKTYQGRINRVRNATPEANHYRKELDTFFGRMTKSLSDAGVRLLAGSDCGAYNSYTYPGISLHKELQAMVANDMTPIQALKTSAYNGADFFNQKKNYGSIAVGKVSDLVVLDANPMENIENTEEIHLVVKGKTSYDSKKLQTFLKPPTDN